MPAPLMVAGAAYRWRKPLGIAGGIGAASILLVPLLAAGGGTYDAVAAPDPCTGQEVAAQVGPVRLPVVGTATVTSNFGMRTNPGDIYKGQRKMHEGIDIAESSPGPIVAAMAGTVKKVFTDSIGTNIVQVDVGGQTVMSYMHLKSFASGLKAGDPVWPGKQLGIEGSTGNSSGPHLHFQIEVKGTAVDPRPWMKQHKVTIPKVGGQVTGQPVVATPPTSTETGTTAQTVADTSTAADDTAADGGSSFSLPKPGTPHHQFDVSPPQSIPADIQSFYTGAAAKFGIPATLLEGIGMAETNHGRVDATSTAGAQGLMQFLPATFKSMAVDGDGDGQTVITDDADSIYTAANYLVKSGVKNGVQGVYQALNAYNHSVEYRNTVLAYAQSYGGGTIASGCDAPIAGDYGKAAVAAAKKWLGVPYVFGGGTVGPPPGPTNGGFDCSGFGAAVVATATSGKLKLPHYSTSIYDSSELSTVAQWSPDSGDAKPISQLQPGDLLVFNVPLSLGFDSHPWNHVGVYIGGGKMINAPYPTAKVRVDDVAGSWNYQWVARRPLAKYTGATASSSSGAATTTTTPGLTRTSTSTRTRTPTPTSTVGGVPTLGGN